MMNKDIVAVKKRILDAAYGRFRSSGVRKVTMDDIASDLRMSKKTLYRHFSGKEELVRTLVLDKYIARQEDIFAAFGRGGTTREIFAEIFPLLGCYVQDISPIFLADVQNEYPEVWNLHEMKRSEMVRRFSTILTAGVKSGEVRSCINPDVTAGIMQCVVSNYMLPDRFRDSEFSMSDAFLTWFSLLTGGMFQDPPNVQEMWDTQVVPLLEAKPLD